MGVPSAVHASVIPSITAENCAMISGFSGFPKFKQFVAATGVAPEQATLRAASATECIAPSFGSRYAQRLLQSSDNAKPRLVPFTRITPASSPGPCAVLVCTMVSYCWCTQRFEQMFGDANSFLNSDVKSRVDFSSVTLAGFSRGTFGFHSPTGRLYSGASSVRD